jgi:ABC-2 type transport system permease protein
VRRELLGRGVRALRRSAWWWGTGIVALAVLSAAFWPSLEGSSALDSFDDMGELLEAFGAENLRTAAGYLDGQLYALMLPLLLSGMAIAGVTALTAGDEDAGRLEILHALPVDRRELWLTRAGAAAVVLAGVTAATTVLMVASLPLFSLEDAGTGRVAAATLGSGLLAAFFASVGYAMAGFGASRGRSIGVAVMVLTLSYVTAFLLPLADALAGARKLSPWYWALGTQPVSDGLAAPRLLLVVAVTAALVMAGTAAVSRRDIRSA